jgi:hypothetical protein
MNESQRQAAFSAVLASWVMTALLVGLITSRFFAFVVIPVAIALWCAVRAVRFKQATQMLLPILLLPGTLMCFIGMMQAFGYGQMSDETNAPYAAARAAYFIVGLLLHFYALWWLANESRASDHLSGECAERI